MSERSYVYPGILDERTDDSVLTAYLNPCQVATASDASARTLQHRHRPPRANLADRRIGNYIPDTTPPVRPRRIQGLTGLKGGSTP